MQIQSLKPSATEGILNEQRLRRPNSPHMTIYQPQLTWYSSIANRITGVGLSVRAYYLIFSLIPALTVPTPVLYGFSLGYLFLPGTFDSAHVVDFVAGLPDAVKYAGKTILALPFAYHGWNGVRHLGWDMGKCASSAYCQACGLTNVTFLDSLDAQELVPRGLRRARSDRCLDHCPRPFVIL